jgi:hypothetical protein
MQTTAAISPEPGADGDRSSLQLYMQEISQTPLLTIAEEIALARGSTAAIAWRSSKSSSKARRRSCPGCLASCARDAAVGTATRLMSPCPVFP